MSPLEVFFFVSILCTYNCKIHNRIVGGSSAFKGQFPYQVSLRLKKGGTHFCGGAILNFRFIITASHCFFDFDKDLDLTKHFHGVINATDFNDPVTQIEFQKLIFHPDFSVRGPMPDIALIRTVQPIIFSEFVKPLGLPKNELIDSGIAAFISGWGLSKVTN